MLPEMIILQCAIFLCTLIQVFNLSVFPSFFFWESRRGSTLGVHILYRPMGTTVPSARMTVEGLATTMANPRAEMFYGQAAPNHSDSGHHRAKEQTTNHWTAERDMQFSECFWTVQFLASLLSYLQTSCSNFRAVSIATNFAAWTEITNDKQILSDVSGVSIGCTETPVQHWLPSQKFDHHESNRINQEINKLVDKRVIETVAYNPQHFSNP